MYSHRMAGASSAPARVSASRSTNAIILLVAILLLGLVLRLWGVGDRLPDPSLGISPLDDSVVEESDRTEMYRAWGMWEGGAKHLTLDPGTVGWPSLSFYLTLAIQVGYRAVWVASHPGDSSAAFPQYFAQHPQGLFLAGRVVAVLLGVWSIYLAYRLGIQAASSAVGLITALLLAFNPLHTQLSQRISDPNLLALLFSLLMAQWLVRVNSDTSLRALLLSSVFIGLAAGAKYVPGVFLVVLLAQVLVWYRAQTRKSATALWLRISLAVLTTMAAFSLSSPYVLLRGRAAWQELQSQGASLTSSWVGQTDAMGALPSYLLHVLPSALTWPVYLLSGLGLLLAFGRNAATRTLASLPILFVLANGCLSIAQARYILVAVPFLLMGAAIAITFASRFVGELSRTGETRATALIAIALLILPLRAAAAYRSEMAQPDSRHAARRWIQANLPPSQPVALELYGPVFNSGGIERLAVTWPFYSSRANAVAPAYSPAFLQGFSYYIASREVRDRFEQDPLRSRREIAYYRWLDRSGVEVWTSRGAHLGGPEIDVLRLPDRISSSAERDSVWASQPLVGCDSLRLAQWCGDLATVNAALGRPDQVVEWAQRGLSLASGRTRINLFGMAGEALVSGGEGEQAVGLLARAVREFPAEYDLLVMYGLALEKVGRAREAVIQFRAALRADPTHPGRGEIVEEIARLERG